MTECKLCEGSRHRWCEERGAYVACTCLRDKQRTERYERAGVPSRYESETWKTFVGTYLVDDVRRLLATAKRLKASDVTADWPLVYGRPTRARMLAGSLMLRSACDGCLDGQMLDVPSLIDAHFEPGRGGDLYELPVLVIEVGGEPENKFNRVVLEKALHKRWEASLFTMLVVDGDPSRVSARYKSSRIVQAFSERFYRVAVAPKEGE